MTEIDKRLRTIDEIERLREDLRLIIKFDFEIDRLRAALRLILQFDADYKSKMEGEWHSGGVPYYVVEIARSALEEKE